MTASWGVSSRLVSASVFTGQSDSSDEHQHVSVFCWPGPAGFLSCWKRSTLLWPLPVCPLLDFTVLCVCILCKCTMFVCIEKMTSMKICAEFCVCVSVCVCVCVCVVRVSQSKQWSQAKWRMEKLHLCKWPLGAVLSVLEGLQGHYTHTHTHTHIYTHTTRRHSEMSVCVLEGLRGRYPTNGAIWSQNKHKLFLLSACNKVMKMLISLRWRNQQKRKCQRMWTELTRRRVNNLQHVVCTAACVQHITERCEVVLINTQTLDVYNVILILSASILIMWANLAAYGGDAVYLHWKLCCSAVHLVSTHTVNGKGQN